MHGQPQPVEIEVFVERPCLGFESKGYVDKDNFDKINTRVREENRVHHVKTRSL